MTDQYIHNTKQLTHIKQHIQLSHQIVNILYRYSMNDHLKNISNNQYIYNNNILDHMINNDNILILSYSQILLVYNQILLNYI